MTTPVPSASESGKLRLGFFTSPAVNVTLFHASAENSDPTCAMASAVSVETSTPPPTSCNVPRLELCQKFAPKFAATAVAFRPRKIPKITSPSSAETLAAVKTF